MVFFCNGLIPSKVESCNAGIHHIPKINHVADILSCCYAIYSSESKTLQDDDVLLNESFHSLKRTYRLVLNTGHQFGDQNDTSLLKIKYGWGHFQYAVIRSPISF